jgi:hypothetical protein
VARRNMDSLHAAALFAACRRLGKDRSFAEISAVRPLSKSQFDAALKRIRTAAAQVRPTPRPPVQLPALAGPRTPGRTNAKNSHLTLCEAHISLHKLRIQACLFSSFPFSTHARAGGRVAGQAGRQPLAAGEHRGGCSASGGPRRGRCFPYASPRSG